MFDGPPQAELPLRDIARDSFENRTAERAGALDLSVRGDFEPAMHGIAEWFRARSAVASRTANAPRNGSTSPGSGPARRKGRA